VKPNRMHHLHALLRRMGGLLVLNVSSFSSVSTEISRTMWVRLKITFTVCNTPKKCVFVRVVDTCAGCAAGSKHVDLTRAAFGQLADFDEGVLQVQLRPATEPHGW